LTTELLSDAYKLAGVAALGCTVLLSQELECFIMGCDIHWHSEVKIAGTWHHYSAECIGRDYWLFGLLADVRNYEDEKPISQPRGLPDDVSAITRIDRESWGVDGHSDSWLSGTEIEQVVEAWTAKRGHERCRQIGYILRFPWDDLLELHERYEQIEDVRWVFWFDN
jgi:hypothetical protein